MGEYICKIASKEEVLKQFDYQISINQDEKEKWNKYKEQYNEIPPGKRITYFGVLDNDVICEATAALSKDIVQNAEGLVDNETAYLFAFRTKDKYRNQGYFTPLFDYMINDLKERGFKYVTLGVEPHEILNKSIYNHYQFNEHIKDDIEYEPDGTEMKVEYYRKTL